MSKDKDKVISLPRIEGTEILMQSILRADGQPMVQLKWGDQTGQLTPEDTRAHAQALMAAAEAAIMDAAVCAWLMVAFDWTFEKAAGYVGNLRRFRGDSDRADWRG